MKTPEELNIALNKLFETENFDYLYTECLPFGAEKNRDLQMRYYTESCYCIEQVHYDYKYWDKHGNFPEEELFNTQDPQEMYNEIKKRFKKRKK